MSATRVIVAVGAFAVVLICGCLPRHGNPDDARLIVAQFVTARQARDLEAAMACFVDQPEMRSSQGVGWTGREAVRAIMAYRITDSYTVGDLHVSGDRVTWSEHVTRVPQAPPSPGAGRAPAIFDEDMEAVVVGGRIASLTTYVAGAQRADPRLSAAPSMATSLLVPLMVLVLVASAVLIWPTGASMRVAPASAANGRLMSGLREYVARRG